MRPGNLTSIPLTSEPKQPVFTSNKSGLISINTQSQVPTGKVAAKPSQKPTAAGAKTDPKPTAARGVVNTKSEKTEPWTPAKDFGKKQAPKIPEKKEVQKDTTAKTGEQDKTCEKKTDVKTNEAEKVEKVTDEKKPATEDTKPQGEVKVVKTDEVKEYVTEQKGEVEEKKQNEKEESAEVKPADEVAEKAIEKETEVEPGIKSDDTEKGEAAEQKSEDKEESKSDNKEKEKPVETSEKQKEVEDNDVIEIVSDEDIEMYDEDPSKEEEKVEKPKEGKEIEIIEIISDKEAKSEEIAEKGVESKDVEVTKQEDSSKEKEMSTDKEDDEADKTEEKTSEEGEKQETEEDAMETDEAILTQADAEKAIVLDEWVGSEEEEEKKDEEDEGKKEEEKAEESEVDSKEFVSRVMKIRSQLDAGQISDTRVEEEYTELKKWLLPEDKQAIQPKFRDELLRAKRYRERRKKPPLSKYDKMYFCLRVTCNHIIQKYKTKAYEERMSRSATRSRRESGRSMSSKDTASEKGKYDDKRSSSAKSGEKSREGSEERKFPGVDSLTPEQLTSRINRYLSMRRSGQMTNKTCAETIKWLKRSLTETETREISMRCNKAMHKAQETKKDLSQSDKLTLYLKILCQFLRERSKHSSKQKSEAEKAEEERLQKELEEMEGKVKSDDLDAAEIYEPISVEKLEILLTLRERGSDIMSNDVTPKRTEWLKNHLILEEKVRLYSDLLILKLSDFKAELLFFRIFLVLPK